MREINEIKKDPKNYFNLIKELVIADFKLRYQNSYLGVLWSLLQPMLLFTVLFFVFSVFARFEIENYATHLLLGVAIWNYFAEASSNSIILLIRNERIIKKIYFPRSALIISITISSFINFLVTLLVLFIFISFSSVEVGLSAILFLFYIFNLFITTLGVSFLVASLSAKFIDLKHIWPVVLRLGFWLTPIAYSVEMIPQQFHFFVYMNPLTRIIQYSRESILQQKFSNLDGILALSLFSSLVLFFGFYVFDKRSRYFTEEL